ncbi:hypothetical protein Acife_2895 [Acidithiobacillus ferrivorans SS3]|uniref:AsmA family protein n=1 Tax=Acidithiobacillus ferrivorans SS3 TaxID=743299 RepID=G0JT63_9PROT|nr:hypothetical protein [Acidithiobacillus ferrivorans]AEM48969.1 hypothetical protein Acife_2895 [Acidithiobacillus ferrivorans SS3]MBU2768198.1 hypothetical protein [Acidithiobacillus ferrivorans]OFA17599.1 hypothetical protein A4U49_01210 [Acidithiobacillus ferrivorans]
MTAVIVVLIFVVLGAVLFWFGGGPRYVLERIFAARLQQPVHLAADPEWHWGKQQLRVTLAGLRVGPAAHPQFSANRLMVTLDWHSLLHGQLQPRQIVLDAPVLNGPWKGGGSVGGAVLSLPVKMIVRDGTLRWPDVVGHILSLTAVNGQVLATGPSQLAGDWHWREKVGRWHFAVEMAPALSARNISLQVGTTIDPTLLQVAIPTLQSAVKEMVVPTLHVRWQARGHGQAQLRLQALRLNMAQSQLAVQDGALIAGNDLALQVQAVDLNWKTLQGHLAYQLSIRRLPQLATRWGLPLPKLTDPNALQRLTSTGTVQLDTPHFQWTVTQGELDHSAWMGKISGTWRPLAIDVNLRMAQLNLGQYLPVPQAGNAAQLPALPQQWPVTGEIHVAKLLWGKIRARDLVIRSTSSKARP